MHGRITSKKSWRQTCRCGRDSDGSEYGSVAVCCEHGNGLRSPYKGGIFAQCPAEESVDSRMYMSVDKAQQYSTAVLNCNRSQCDGNT